MTHLEIVARAVWREPDQARLVLPDTVLGPDIAVEIFTEAPQRISARSVAIVNDLLALTPAQLEQIKVLLWQNCLGNCEDCSYGAVEPREGQTWLEANLEAFGVHDPQSAWEQCSVRRLGIHESDEADFTANYGRLAFDNAWDSHITTVFMRDGEIAGEGDSGTWIGRFEPPPKD